MGLFKRIFYETSWNLHLKKNLTMEKNIGEIEELKEGSQKIRKIFTNLQKQGLIITQIDLLNLLKDNWTSQNKCIAESTFNRYFNFGKKPNDDKFDDKLKTINTPTMRTILKTLDKIQNSKSAQSEIQATDKMPPIPITKDLSNIFLPFHNILGSPEIPSYYVDSWWYMYDNHHNEIGVDIIKISAEKRVDIGYYKVELVVRDKQENLEGFVGLDQTKNYLLFYMVTTEANNKHLHLKLRIHAGTKSDLCIGQLNYISGSHGTILSKKVATEFISKNERINQLKESNAEIHWSIKKYLDNKYINGLISPSEVIINIKGLEKLVDKQVILNEQQNSADNMMPYIFDEIRIDRKLVFNKEHLCLDVMTLRTFKVLGNDEQVLFIDQKILFVEGEDGDIENIEINLLHEKSKRAYGDIAFKLIYKEQTRSRYEILFNPPLRKGEEAEYQIQITHKKARVLTNEGFLLRKVDKKSVIDSFYNRYSYSISFPTNRLISTWEFPKNYPIYVHECVVTKKKQLIQKEMNRIKDNYHIVKTDGIKLILDIAPLRGLAYGIQWKSPKINDLLQVGFITENEAEEIRRINRERI